ncbi:HD domain-containing protein [Luteimonas sp. A478]
MQGDIFASGPLALPAAQTEAIQAAYRSPPRDYHNLNHVAEVLGHYADVAAGPGWARPAEAWLAVLYHDAIYEAKRRDNEVRSARLAAEHIQRWLPEAVDAARVSWLIELTARHGQHLPEDFGSGADADDVRHFLDCDMAILGADPDLFDAYNLAIAAEYRGHVPGWLFRLNRRRFLKALLERPRIFLSDLFHQRYDSAARANLRRVLQGVAPN